MPMTCRSPWLLPNRLRSLLIIALHDFIYWPRPRPPAHKKEDAILMKHTASLQSGPFVRPLNHITPINYKIRANRATRPPWPCITILWTTNGLIPPWMIHTPSSQKVATINLNKFHGYTPQCPDNTLGSKNHQVEQKNHADNTIDRQPRGIRSISHAATKTTNNAYWPIHMTVKYIFFLDNTHMAVN